MMWRDIISLVSESEIENELGDIITIDTPKQVFANKKSVRQNEFYQAQAAGLKPELMFEIRYMDYEEEKNIIFNNKPYRVIRTYTKNEETIELICEGVVANANA
jgi:SPP1 family predicted phage head-tail adaptor